jgi:hypothetical protein
MMNDGELLREVDTVYAHYERLHLLETIHETFLQ